MPDDWVFLGKITRTQGHRGQVRMQPAFSPPELFAKLRTDQVFLRPAPPSKGAPLRPASAGPPPPRQLTISTSAVHQGHVILRFAEIPDMNAAERLPGLEVYVPQHLLWRLPRGQYFEFQLLGLPVYETTDGPATEPRRLGTIEKIQDGHPHDYFLCLLAEGAAPSGHHLLIPNAPSVVQRINATEGPNAGVFVQLPPGFLELAF